MSRLRWRGLRDLVRDAVLAGSQAVEQVQIATARRPFAVLEAIPTIAVPAKLVHVAHDFVVGGVHQGIRFGTQVLSEAAGLLLDHLPLPEGKGTGSVPPDESSG